MSDPGSKPSEAVINNTFNFNGPVGSVAQATGQGAKAAGRDIVEGGQPVDLPAMLLALRQVLDSHPPLVADPKRRGELIEMVDDINTVVAKPVEQRSDTDARLVKRCLEGLKQGAEAVESGAKIVNTLEPVWNGLKLAWPVLAAMLL